MRSEKIYYSMVSMPILKNVFIASTDKGVCMVDYHTSERRFLRELKKRRPGEVTRDDKKNKEVLSQLKKYVKGELKRFDCPLDMQGNLFENKVWSSLIKIPYGQTRSYKDIAEAIGHPKAFRAVGNANGANPVPIIVPCHRVIESNGGLGGYGGGVLLKKRLLALEKANGF